jgi:hypothetical protein
LVAPAVVGWLCAGVSFLSSLYITLKEYHGL